MADQKKKSTSYAARSGGKTTPIGKSAAGSRRTGRSSGKKTAKSVKKVASAAKGASSGYKRAAKGKNGKLNWAFIVAGAVLLSTYLIVVLFNGFDWSGWDDGVSDLRDTASDMAGNLSSAWSEVKDIADSAPNDLTLDTSGANGTFSSDGEVRVHYIDIGQGDSILIEGSGQSVLIDAGDNDKGDIVLAYLEKCGIETVDIAIGSHPHADHIGGMDTVLEGKSVSMLLMPDVPDSIIPTTKTYLSVLDAAEEKDVATYFSYPGDSYEICGGTLNVLGPVNDYKSLNNESLVVRFDYGSTRFLFTGDQEAEAEKDLLASGADVSADVLKIGHHGSSTSTSQSFFDAVSPSIAIISCGAGNDYGHPHTETKQLLAAAGIEVYRTDLQGSIVITSNGTDLQVATEKTG